MRMVAWVSQYMLRNKLNGLSGIMPSAHGKAKGAISFRHLDFGKNEFALGKRTGSSFPTVRVLTAEDSRAHEKEGIHHSYHTASEALACDEPPKKADTLLANGCIA